MENLSFVIWMLLFPLVVCLEKFLYKKINIKQPEDSEGAKVIGCVIEIFIWIYVGSLLIN